MKIKDTYVLRSIADEHIVVPTGQEGINFNGVLTLNASGKLLFETLQKGATIDDLKAVLLATYEVDETTAQKDVEKFIKKLDSKDIIIHD